MSSSPTVTLADVAREAGVSKSTASLVLRDSPLVAAATREHVRATMARLGYRPSRIAIGMRGTRFFIVGVIATDLAYPHYAQTTAGAGALLEAAGYRMMLAVSYDDPNRERIQIEDLRGYRAEGIIITPAASDGSTAEHLRALQEEGYPLVCVGRELPDLETDFCGTDLYGGTRTVLSYLAGDLGHRHIAFLGGAQRSSTSLHRIAAWRDELGKRGLTVNDALLVRHEATLEGGEAGMMELLGRGIPFTAVACINDLTALGALRALHQAGRRVPEDVSVAGFGGLPFLSPPAQPLTTMVEDYLAIGRQAATLLLRRMRDPHGAPVRITLPAQLRAGATTARRY